ncbi:chaperonin [Nissabacter sp. SGAir0207]|uniref:chaperonin n=1 Tax=Nissabacter sp. SGAir0207 TaxID=2126321 RepID=UPI0010CD2FE7|nr:chaperonin [Nissabacter sp. SGAir0207]QCR38932.1 chaperonin [Nissabacter sp. SGAir0207]
MKKDKVSLYQTALADGVGEAKLQVNPVHSKTDEPTPAKREVRTKTLKAIPTSYFDAHQKLRDNNKTGLDFSNYILEALREKLERDGAL